MTRIFVFTALLAAPLCGARADDLPPERPSDLSGAVEPGEAYQPPAILDAPIELDEARPLAPEAGPAHEVRAMTAQLMIVTPQGVPSPDAEDALFFRTYTPGGIILPKLMRPSTAAAYVAALRSLPLETRSGQPLLIGANLYELPNYELGPRNFFPALPSLLSISAAHDPDTTAALGKLMTELATAIGINFHLGPSLELAPTRKGARGTIHTLGGNSDFVAESGIQLIKAFEAGGVLPMPTGFPGGGNDRTRDEPPVLQRNGDAFLTNDLFPYAMAIEAGVPLIHVGNTRVPGIDPQGLPASLSPAVIRGLLRNTLEFDGIVVAGPMDHPDITAEFDPTSAALMAFKAGADMVLWDSAGTRVAKSIDEIAVAVIRANVSGQMVRDAHKRVGDFKKAHALMDRDFPKAKEAEVFERKRRYPKATYAMERRALTLIRNRGALLPLREDADTPVGITGVFGVEELYKPLEKEFRKQVAMQPLATARHGGRVMDFEIDRAERTLKLAETVVCILSSKLRSRGQVELVQKMASMGKRIVAVVVGDPSLAAKLGGVDAIVLSYADDEALKSSMQAVADVLIGRPPIDILPYQRELHVRTGQELTVNVFDVIRTPVGRLPLRLSPEFPAGTAVAYPPAGAVDKVLWDFGDGKREKGETAAHAYNTPGRYELTLEVTDQQDFVARGVFPVNVTIAASREGISAD